MQNSIKIKDGTQKRSTVTVHLKSIWHVFTNDYPEEKKAATDIGSWMKEQQKSALTESAQKVTTENYLSNSCLIKTKIDTTIPDTALSTLDKISYLLYSPRSKVLEWVAAGL